MRQLKIQERITDRRELTIDKYISELTGKEFEKLSPEQETECAIMIQAGLADGSSAEEKAKGDAALEILVKANLRFVVSVAKQYQHAGPLMDLVNEGNVGLIHAATRFDHKRGFKFISYAVWWIRQAILKYLNEHYRIVKLPLNKIQALNKLHKVQESLKQELSREPSQEEMEESFLETEFAQKHNTKNIKDLLKADTRKLSLDYNMSNKGGDEVTLLDFLSTDEDEADPLFNESIKIELNRFLVKLKPTEKMIIELFYGLNGNQPHTLSQITEVIYLKIEKKLTRERIRQIKSKAEKKMRYGAQNSELLKQYLG